MQKRHILEEIRRLAQENDGSPVGRERFERETGIRESDWSGKYWVRWNDAVKEAGFEPNKLNTAHEDDFMLSQYIGLVRELGRVPVQAELEMKRRQDNQFPSAKTFRRFGGKADLIRRAAEFSRANGHTDTLEICEVASKATAEAEIDEPAPDDFEIGYVYLLKSGRYYKIGRTNAIGRREYEIGLQLPEKASTVHILKTDDPVGIESYWHRRFADRRKNGEWFELSPADVKAFRRRKFM
jgi:hypothetical protein